MPSNEIGGRIPLVRFVEHEFFVKHIRPLLVQKVCNALRSRFNEKDTDVIDEKGENYGSYEAFIQGKCSQEKEEKLVKLLKTNSEEMLNSFLLAKAWLSHEPLYHVMSYRYRVEYGLSNKSEKEIAVPFKGKDLPSENSEFSHPDVMIGFTIISYLYRGLSLEQVKKELIKLKYEQDKDRLLKQWVQENKEWIGLHKEWTDEHQEWIEEHNRNENATFPSLLNAVKTKLLKHQVQENKDWIDKHNQKENATFPSWLNSFKTLDLEDEERVKKIHIYLCRNFDFVEYYLSSFTFPHDAKYYKRKLTGNAHTLAGEGETKGFSGTDDRNDIMPESIIPKRLPSQKETNGKMLHILS
ncbi:unnamed protein product [Didymodactylos carnosus]|uniref:ubiquitinyl hydrolase 1 n=2 Tax=Didymodactylos carnosus TaxID=1234261 RepID=A0A815SWN1_9BILA|nr:unnamed protein product [Didymodactylos carnosus]CAF4356888.1 unnamed protein product [Didymodactylos carnosus]